MTTRTLSPILERPDTFEVIALDSEGSGAAGDFVIAVCYDNEGAHVFKDREKIKPFLFSRRNLGKKIVAANLEYDYAVCFQPFTGNYEITLANRKWIKAVYSDVNKHAWTAIDIQRIAPMSVDGMGKVIGIEKYPTPPALVRDRDYHPKSWKCRNHNRTFCIECYCIRDAEITYKFTMLFQQGLNELGGEMKLTAASSAMDLFRRSFLDDDIPITLPDRNELGRQAYYGGRVEVFKIGTSYDVNVYDVNSLYPSVMQNIEVGRPDTYRRKDRPKDYHYWLDGFGQFFGTIYVPETNIGLLPFRSNDRLYFPTGDIKGSWMLSEVRAALKQGARIKECNAILYATQTIQPFKRYIQTLYDIKLKYSLAGRPDVIVPKLMMNSLYGKFAQRTESDFKTLIVPPKRYELETYADCDPVYLLNRELFLREIETHIQPSFIHVQWSAEITSQARLKLYDLLQSEEGRVIYCDTDSVHTTGTMQTSNALGAVKLEHDFLRSTYFAPKEYGGQERTGEFIHRAKGIPPAFREKYLTEGAVEFKQPVHTLTAIRTNGRIAEWRPVHKQRRSSAMNRNHLELTDFNEGRRVTYPFDVDEVA